MSQRDIIGLIVSYLYAFGLLGVTEAIGKWLRWPQSFTRKIVHIGAGLWIWGILALFDHWYYGIIPFGTFIVLNFIFYRWQVFKAMDTAESTPGTVYFAISITLLFAWLWRTGGEPDRAPAAAAGVMAMTLGDAAASLVGQRWGRHWFTTFKHPRSWEGTAAMAVCSLIGIWLTLLWLPGSPLSPFSPPLSGGAAALIALVGAAVATAAEALSPAGTDNLSVPLLSGLTVWLLYNGLAG